MEQQWERIRNDKHYENSRRLRMNWQGTGLIHCIPFGATLKLWAFWATQIVLNSHIHTCLCGFNCGMLCNISQSSNETQAQVRQLSYCLFTRKIALAVLLFVHVIWFCLIYGTSGYSLSLVSMVVGFCTCNIWNVNNNTKLSILGTKWVMGQFTEMHTCWNCTWTSSSNIAVSFHVLFQC